MNFISEKDIKKDESNQNEEVVDHRPLYDRLKEVRDKKQLEFEEERKLKNQFRGIDSDEAEFLRQINDCQNAVEIKKKTEEKELINIMHKESLNIEPSTITTLKPVKVNSKQPKTINKQASLISSAIRKRPRESDKPISIDKDDISTDCKKDLIEKKIDNETGEPVAKKKIADLIPEKTNNYLSLVNYNTSRQVTSTHVVNHYNAVPNTTIKDRTSSRIFYLRNFNNWMKSMLISEFLDRLKEEGCSSATVLDFCCGKGGDLLKWKIGNIKEVLMTDVADIALEHCRSRYKELLNRFSEEKKVSFKTHFVAADLTTEDLSKHFPQKDMLFDLCSCQFALHYAFSSMESTRNFLKNATKWLRKGGYFIGSIPDANMIVRYLRQSDKNGTFSNNVCRIDFVDKSQKFDTNFQPPLFGAKLNFELEEVVNCPEYLAYFPLIEKVLEEFGMKLIYKYSFCEATDYYLKKKPNSKNLLTRMKALENYPPLNNARLVNDISEYEYAEEQFQILNNKNSYKILGTLSKSEWEVASMYLVFAFVKEH